MKPKQHYCDTRELERIWSNWTISNNIPCLEPIRGTGKLWSKPLNHGRVSHVVVTADANIKTYEFYSVNGRVEISDFKTALARCEKSYCREHADTLKKNNYYHDLSSKEAWERLAQMIYRICEGTSLNFNPPNDEIRAELINDAFQQTLSKISRGKLRFTPGKAPVFNLLTTAIMRIMFSIKNKEKRIETNKNKLTNDLINRKTLPHSRSLAVSQSTLGSGKGHST
jgi:hypothetical protein